MLNNINTGNETAFKASFRVNVPVKDSARLKNIQTLFAEKTGDMKDILSISKADGFEGQECLFVGSNIDNSVCAFLENKIDTMMEKLSDNDIATKLVKALKVLKSLNRKELATRELEGEMYRANHEIKRNKTIAANCREKEDIIMADRFEFLASCFQKKLDKINAKRDSIKSNMIDKIEKIAEGDKDILDMTGCV